MIFNLSTLDLNAATHEVYVKLRKVDHKDSPASNTLQYTLTNFLLQGGVVLMTKNNEIFFVKEEAK